MLFVMLLLVVIIRRRGTIFCPNWPFEKPGKAKLVHSQSNLSPLDQAVKPEWLRMLGYSVQPVCLAPVLAIILFLFALFSFFPPLHSFDTFKKLPFTFS